MSAVPFEGRAFTFPRIDWEAALPKAIAFASAAQFCILAWISFNEVTRRSLMWDFAVNYQTFYAIANGRIDGNGTVAGLPFATMHGSFLMWPLGVVGAICSAPLTLKLLSDGAAALATLVGLGWAREIVERETPKTSRLGGAIVVTCIAVAILNPWTYQSNAFDFHFYAISALAAVGLGRALYNGKNGAACGWMLLGISAGDVSTTIVTATAFGLALVLPYSRSAGFSLALAGAVAFAAMDSLGYSVGDQFARNFPYVHGPRGGPNAFAVLSWLLAHPGFVETKIASHADALYANLAPGGFIGFLSPFTAVPIALVLFENVMTTNVHDFIWPGNESAPVYYLMVPGLAWTLVWMLRLRMTAVVAPACLLIAANCAGWFHVWFPLVQPQWIRVAPAAAAGLDDLHDRIGAKDEVIASDRFLGSFADREIAYGFHGGRHFPISARTYVAISARDGTAPNAWAQTYGGIATLLGRPDARLLSVSHGLWIFEFPHASRPFDPPMTIASLPAAVFEGDVGRRDLSHAAMNSDGRAGYLIRDAIWRDPPGDYAAHVTAAGPLAIEAWDASRGILLARKSFSGAGDDVLGFSLPYKHGNNYYTGAWIFRCGSQIKDDGNDWIELRVAVPAGAQTQVQTVALGGDKGLVPNF